MARPKRTVLEYRNYELPADFPIVLLTGDMWHISPVPGKHLHFHNCLEIGICHSSGGTMVLGNTKIHFKAGDVTCIARNVPHTTWSDQDAPSLWSYLFLDSSLLLGNTTGEAGSVWQNKSFFSESHLIVQQEEQPRVKQYVENIIEELTEKAPGYKLCVRCLCTALLTDLERIYNAGHTGNTIDPYIHSISPALDYIYSQYMTSFPQDTLAQLCHLSPTHFRRIFKEQTGTSPLTFLHQTRILKSCSLLRSSELPIAVIAEEVGYNSLSSYSRHFLELMGCSPNVWRKTSAENNRPSLINCSGWTEAEDIEYGTQDGTVDYGL